MTNRAFSLIELMSIIAIFAIIAAIAIPNIIARNSMPETPVLAKVIDRQHVPATNGSGFSSNGKWHSYSTSEKWEVILSINEHTDSYNVSADDWGEFVPGTTALVRVTWVGVSFVSHQEPLPAQKVER